MDVWDSECGHIDIHKAYSNFSNVQTTYSEGLQDPFILSFNWPNSFLINIHLSRL